ncbi:MAG: hypothetical protein J7515_08020 [Caulobacter sp.]|nr:hypothetical protein [Caulobacter sp.]
MPNQIDRPATAMAPSTSTQRLVSTAPRLIRPAPISTSTALGKAVTIRATTHPTRATTNCRPSSAPTRR